MDLMKELRRIIESELPKTRERVNQLPDGPFKKLALKEIADCEKLAEHHKLKDRKEKKS